MHPLIAGRRRYVAAAGLGIVAAAGMAPILAWPLTLLGFAGWLALHQSAATGRRAAITGWAFAAGYFGAALHWLVEPFLVDIARHGWMAPFGIGFMAGGLALFWGGAAWGADRLRTGRAGWALAITLAEILRAYVFGGFPWANPAQVLIDTPAAQTLAWTGPYGLTFGLLAVAALLQMAASKRRLNALAPAALVAALSCAPAVIASDPVPDVPAPLVRLVQPNAPQNQKWHPDHAPMFFRRSLALSAPDQAVPDLVVWPESSVPVWRSRADEAFATMARAAGGATVVAGINTDRAGRAYNSLVAIGPDGQVAAQYDKHHLVPYGEYLPASWLLSRLGFAAFTPEAGYGFSAGPGPRLIDLGPAGQALPLICYEAIFPQDLRGTARPDWLLQLTNDAWFGNFAGPQQHLAQARMRAIEQGLPLIRAANTGISAVIDARGRTVASLPLNTAGYLDATLPPALAPTLYARTGDLPFGAMAVAILAILALRSRRESV